MKFNSKSFTEDMRITFLGTPLRKLSRQTKVSPATLSRIFRGKTPDLITFGKLCKALGSDDISRYLK